MIKTIFTSNFSRNSFLIAFAVYLLTAYHSVGFYHADEHYQILEFANMRLGNSPADELPWEYKKQIRPVVQVSIAMIVIGFLEQISITNPYTQVLILRVFTVFIVLLISSFFIGKTRHLINDLYHEKIYIVSSYFLWFLPFLSSRFSSEIWSGIFFLLMISLYLGKNSRRSTTFLIGFVAAFSFLLRFQIGFALIGFLGWVFFVEKETKQFFLKFILSFAIVLVLGFFLDTWFYQVPTFSPLNYLIEFIATNNAQNYGISPWYFYFERLLTVPTLLVGIPLLISLIVFFVKNPKNIFTWILLSFLFFHSVIGHKEVRFMFPMVYILPLVLSLIFFRYIGHYKHKIVIRVVFFLFFSCNFLLVILMSFKGMGRGRLVIAKYVYEYYNRKEIDVIYTSESYLFQDPSGPLTMNFYKQPNLNLIQVNNPCEISSLIENTERETLVVIELGDLKLDNCIDTHDALFLKESLPVKKEWISTLNALGFKIPKLDKMLLLYEFSSKN